MSSYIPRTELHHFLEYGADGTPIPPRSVRRAVRLLRIAAIASAALGILWIDRAARIINFVSGDSLNGYIRGVEAVIAILLLVVVVLVWASSSAILAGKERARVVVTLLTVCSVPVTALCLPVLVSVLAGVHASVILWTPASEAYVRAMKLRHQ